MRIWLCLALGGTFVAKADFQANVNLPGVSFSAPRGLVRLTLDPKLEKATVTTKNTKYVFDVGVDRGRHGDFHVSDDGRSVLFLRKGAFLGQILDDPRSAGLKPDPIEGLALWRDGKLVASRTWEGLLTRRQMFDRSISHLHWLLDAKVDWKANEATVVTTSFRRYRFRLDDGRFLEEADLPSFAAAGRIAYGSVRLEENGEFLQVVRWDKGTGPARLRVRREPNGPDLDRDAEWLVSEPVDGVAAIREYVDEVTAQRRNAAAAVTNAATAPKFYAVLLVGAKATRTGEDVEFRRGEARDALLRLDVREWLPREKKLYEAVLFLPAELPKEPQAPLGRFLDQGLLYERGQWSNVRVQSELKGSPTVASTKALDGALTFRSPAREELVEVRLSSNPYSEAAVTKDLQGSLKPWLDRPAEVSRHRFASP